MQPASPSGTTTLLNDAGQPYGVVLGGDYTSEHENGIKRLKTRLGIPHGRIPFAQMRSTIVPDIVGCGKGVGKEKLMTDAGYEDRSSASSWMWLGRTDSKEVQRLVRRYQSSESVFGAWDECSFAVRGWEREGMALVDMLNEAIANRDLSVWIGGASNVFARGGLVVVRHSMVPAEHSATFDEAVEDANRLRSAALATGIEERLKSGLKNGIFGLPWFALSPRWRSDNDKSSAHPVIFWLNPSDQQNNNHGWFTVEELDGWIKGEGPIPKKNDVATMKKVNRR